MSIKGRDKEFRTPKTTYVDFKHIEMDRVLTMLFPRLKYDGYASRRPPRGGDLTVEEFMEDFLEHPEWFAGFDRFPQVVHRWIETDLMDVVNRGKANQALAAPRPLHGNTYKFRNAKHTRDYGAAEQIYWMLFYARKGKGQAARDALKRFFFPGIDLVTDRYDPNASVDVETQAILRLDHQVTQDMKDSKEPSRFQPLCIGQADIMADDILRLLAYEPYIPRSVLVDYLKTLMAFHLALYHLKLLQMLPKLVKQRSGNDLCTAKECPINPGLDNALEGCPYRVALVVDMGDVNNPHMAELARKSTDRLYRQIPAFVQANFVIKKLDEMAEYLSKKTGKLATPGGGVFTVGDLVSLLKPEHDAERQAYFKFRLASLIEESTSGNEDVDPEIREVTGMGLGEFESFIEILMAYRGKYHRQYITECLDSLLLKNKENGLLAQSRTKGSPRRFVMGSKLLEVLLQIAVLTQDGGRFVTREVRIEELLAFLRNRYGLHIDRLPEGAQGNSSILDRRALRLNLEAFKRRLREIGFYEDLSDAYVTQKVSPRYAIERNDGTDKNGRHA
ncbi:methylation-associated defense system protein MAD7 [Aeromonas dhakensis]|uniref:methylation-associated defense system protein MAD7 n=1 Tax=Aeromonas dhakensis TaxID=196024 RepID=UPI00300DCC45